MSNPAALSVSMSNPSAQSLASSGNTGAGRLPLYIAHRIALTYTLFPNLTFTLSDSSSPVDGMDELDPEVWQTGGEGGEDDGEVKALRGKDPEKLALASRFLARITKGYQREGAFASSTHSPTTSPSFPKLISSFPPSRNGGLVLAASNPDSNEGVFLQWGWHSLLLPLLRTWSGILRFLIGNELRVVREIDVGDEKREKERREAYTRAEDHLESYIRVLVERISVDAVSVDKNPHLQRELIRGLTTWSLVGHQRRKFTTAEATDVVDGDGDRDQEGKVIRMDHTEIQPIFDTYVVFWRGKIWISDSGSLSSAEETTFSFSSLKVDESTPFQFSITSPSYVDIDELVWSEVRLGLVFEYESYETEARSEEEDSTEGAHAPEEGGSKVQTRVRDAVIVIRSTQKQPVPPTEPQDEGNHLVSCINIGDINFGGSNFDSGKRVIEREVETDMLLRWRLGETKVFTGSVGVVEGSGIGEGRVTVTLFSV
ncbi:hypothetical protein D9757_000464 [Collybiopsis confluens]|uniref:Uncharacterized protein n=1 Tax=Collybiopsis confluens TaxID=2823264 RepID=A0A8H5MGW0_9AGAR|nr:hypothetical protein D9757_000464 [Collybiopsis confluens]